MGYYKRMDGNETKPTKTRKAKVVPIIAKEAKPKAKVKKTAKRNYKWSEMTDQEKKEQMARSKEYAHKRKAKDLGITLEEYRARLELKKKGKTAKEAGLQTSMRITKLDKFSIKDIRALIEVPKGSYVPAEDPTVAHNIMRQSDQFRVLFRKGNLVVARHLKYKPTGTEESDPRYFINLETRKQFPFVRESDYAPTASIKNAEAIQWENASKLN